jgi:hypothetical protein
MKYTINGFSQEAALSMRVTVTENSRTKTINLDHTDLIILRWIVDFYPNMKKTIIEGAEYAWLDYATFVEDMPLLGLSKQSLYKRCKKMVQLGVLTHKTIRNGGTFSYFGFGPKYSTLIGKPRKTAQAPTGQSPAPAQSPCVDTVNTSSEQFQLPVSEPEPQPQPKKTRKAKSFDAIIDSYTSDPEIKGLLGAWIQNRKAKRAAMTDRAIQDNINAIDRFAQESRMSVKDYLAEVVRRGWGSFFAINNYQRTGYQQQKPQQQIIRTPEEQRQHDEEIDYFLKNCVF